MIALMWGMLRLFVSRRAEEEARSHAQDADVGHQHHMAGGELSWRERLTSAEAWSDVAHNFRGDWQMLYKEITIGFLLAGFIALRPRGRGRPRATVQAPRSAALAFREAAKRDETHEGDDEPQPEARHDHQSNADDEEDATHTHPLYLAAPQWELGLVLVGADRLAVRARPVSRIKARLSAADRTLRSGPRGHSGEKDAMHVGVGCWQSGSVHTQAVP